MQMNNLFLEKTERGEKTVGVFIESGLSAVGEAIGYTDMDYVIIDSEHGPYSVESAMELIRSVEAQGKVTPFVRVKDSQRNSILKMLDVGAKGLIIPQVHSLDEIKEIVRVGKYFPVGERGVSYGRCAGWGYADHAKDGLTKYFEACNKNQLLIPQCETRGCLEQIEEIAAMPGIDGIFVGPYDLSTALGKPGQFDDPEFLAALDRITKAVKAAGKFEIIYCDNPEVAKKRIAAGFDSVAVNIDVVYYVNAMNDCVKQIKG